MATATAAGLWGDDGQVQAEEEEVVPVMVGKDVWHDADGDGMWDARGEGERRGRAKMTGSERYGMGMGMCRRRESGGTACRLGRRGRGGCDRKGSVERSGSVLDVRAGEGGVQSFFGPLSVLALCGFHF